MSAQRACPVIDDASEARELRSLLHAAAQELADLSRAGDTLHALLDRAMAAAPLSEGGVEDAQLIDYLVQHLQGVSLFLRLVADEAPDARVDYARLRRRLPLAGLASRLGGEAGPEPGSAGDLDLF